MFLLKRVSRRRLAVGPRSPVPDPSRDTRRSCGGCWEWGRRGRSLPELGTDLIHDRILCRQGGRGTHRLIVVPYLSGYTKDPGLRRALPGRVRRRVARVETDEDTPITLFQPLFNRDSVSEIRNFSERKVL